MIINFSEKVYIKEKEKEEDKINNKNGNKSNNSNDKNIFKTKLRSRDIFIDKSNFNLHE